MQCTGYPFPHRCQRPEVRLYANNRSITRPSATTDRHIGHEVTAVFPRSKTHIRRRHEVTKSTILFPYQNTKADVKPAYILDVKNQLRSYTPGTYFFFFSSTKRKTECRDDITQLNHIFFPYQNTNHIRAVYLRHEITQVFNSRFFCRTEILGSTKQNMR